VGEIYGNADKILHIDLSTGKVDKEPVTEDMVKEYLGGVGFCWALAREHIKQGVDSFSPENVIIIGTPALVGTSMPSCGKISLITKMAMPGKEDGTCYIGSAQGGSHLFPTMLKNAGYAALVIKGKAEKPSYLKIIDDDVEICDATDLWGKTNICDTEWALKEKHGNDTGVLSIGKAGENLIRSAMPLMDSRGTVGRHGVGAVFGSKNLKAIVTRGTKGVKVADGKRFNKAAYTILDRETNHPIRPLMNKAGYSAKFDMWINLLNLGNWPTMKFATIWDTPPGLEHHIKSMSSCGGCAFACKAEVAVSDGPYKGDVSHCGHYVLMAHVGAETELEDRNECIKLNAICQDEGLCSYTATHAADWLIRMYQQGAISKEKVGFELKKDFDTFYKLINMMLNREGIGDVMADGLFALGKYLGIDPTKDYESRGMIKGVNSTAYDARITTFDPLRFIYLTSPRPQHAGFHSTTTVPSYVGDEPMPLERLKEFMSSEGIAEDKLEKIFTPVPYYGAGFNVALYAAEQEHTGIIWGCLGTCSIVFGALRMGHIDEQAECFSAATGIEMTAADLRERAEKIWNINKALNVLEGFSREDDWSEAWVQPRHTPYGAVLKLMDYYRTRYVTRENVIKLLDDYYETRGWDVEKGIPTQASLKKLGLDDLAKKFAEKGLK